MDRTGSNVRIGTWLLLLGLGGLWATGGAAAEPCEAPCCSGASESDDPWIRLFDGETLGHWEVTAFGGEGEVRVEEERIVLPFGNDLTGITWKKDKPPARMNYEIELEAMRVDGGDFFCGLTFPVGEDPCTFVVGGWGGGLVGLSNVDGFDASENDTSSWINFENDRWYLIRLRVTEDAIEAWIDHEKVVDVDIRERRLSVRPEVRLSRPLGIATWRTTGAVRNIRLRHLDVEDELID